MKPVYKVMIDDNFHFMDESERYMAGAFATAEEAIEACKRIVERSLEESYKPGMTAEELYDSYTSFGEDPFIIIENATKRDLFSAWDYARQRSREITKGGAA